MDLLWIAFYYSSDNFYNKFPGVTDYLIYLYRNPSISPESSIASFEAFRKFQIIL